MEPPPFPDDAPVQVAPKDIHRFPCSACGADLRFDPAAGNLICDHCGNIEEMEGRSRGPWAQQSAIRELDFRAALRDQLPAAELETTQVLNCQNCGAQVEFDPAIHAAECPFCASPVVTGTGENRHIKPRAVLPFALDEAAAHKAMKEWLGRLWFAPSGLQKYARRGGKMDGVYAPYWTFDAQTRSEYRGQRGTVYYQTRRVVINGKSTTQRVAKVRWRGVSGRVARFFDDVLVLGSRSLPKSFTDALPPWDLSLLEPYTPGYLAGLRAEAYTLEIDDAFLEARAIMDRVIERDVRFDIGGDRQRVHHIETELSAVTFKHILLPIWIAAYRFQGKSYRCVVNGQTGRVQGERPWSTWKIALAILAGVLVAGAIGYAIAVEQGTVPSLGVGGF
ncbi:MAG: TFIIB-type zinc finger domain-containing protein [Pseudomonadota bacterium]